VRVAKTPTLLGANRSQYYSFFVKNLDQGGAKSRLLVGVFECCADSHDCGVLGGVCGCLEYYVGGGVVVSAGGIKCRGNGV